MRSPPPPVRFIVGVLLMWIGARVAMHVGHGSGGPAAMPQAVPDPVSEARTPSRPVALPAAPILSPDGAYPPFPRRLVLAPPQSLAVSRETMEERTSLPAPAEPPVAPPLAREKGQPFAPAFVPPPIPRPAARWSGSAFLFQRGSAREDPLAPGGQLGGSQAGVRLAYRLNPNGPTRFAVAGRVYTPLANTRQAEAALGADWHPLPGKPLRVSVERRFDVGGEGRSAWSAYAAGGFYRSGLPAGLELDGYAQAGVVGIHARDLFADGSLRLGKRMTGPAAAPLILGVAVWGAAQPEISRLDVGPRVALSLPLAQSTLTAAVEVRLRVAGSARPGSGLALTLALDF